MQRALLLGAVLGAYAADASAHAAFLSMLPDIPIAPGLSEQADAAAVFEEGAGRVVIARAAGQSDPDAVRLFYEQTLPALGWGKDGFDAYNRGRERLRLSIEEQKAPKALISVRFALIVAPASASLD